MFFCSPLWLMPRSSRARACPAVIAAAAAVTAASASLSPAGHRLAEIAIVFPFWCSGWSASRKTTRLEATSDERPARPQMLRAGTPVKTGRVRPLDLRAVQAQRLPLHGAQADPSGQGCARDRPPLPHLLGHGAARAAPGR